MPTADRSFEFIEQFCSPSPHQGSLLSAKKGKEVPFPCVKWAKNDFYQATVPVLEPLQSVEVEKDVNSASHAFPRCPKKGPGTEEAAAKGSLSQTQQQHFYAW